MDGPHMCMWSAAGVLEVVELDVEMVEWSTEGPCRLGGDS